MLRHSLPLSVALVMSLGCGEALAARASVQTAGEVRALALGGPTIVVARRPDGRAIVVERVTPGAAAQLAYATTMRGDDDQVVLAASAAALAVGVEPENGSDYSPSRALAGALGGPLREVAVCGAGLVVPPVAVSAARIAWRDGACAEPAEGPKTVGTAALVTAGVDGSASRRIVLPADSLPVAIVLAGDGGLVGVLRPSFFAVNSAVYRFGPRGLELLVEELGRIVAPVGVLDDGTAVLALTNSDGSPEGTGTRDCSTGIFTLAPGGARNPVALGGCPQVADLPFAPNGARAAGTRISALLTDPRSLPGRAAPPLVSVVSARADGSDRRVHASGTYRPPLGITADHDRVAWWQRTCAATSEIVVEDHAAAAADSAANAPCRASILTRRARVRGGRASVRVRCRPGCSATLFEVSEPLPDALASFRLPRGTHTVRVPVRARARRRGRLELLLEVEGGPARSAVVRLRR